MSDAATVTVNEEAEQIIGTLLKAPPPDPYPLYARLREIAPIYRPSFADFWTLTRYDDVAAAFKEKKFVRNYEDMRERIGQPLDMSRPFDRVGEHFFHLHNPPEYLPKRALYNTAFNRNYVETLRPMMQGFVDELLDEAEQRGEMNVVEDLSFGLTVRVVCSTIGVPLEKSDLLVNWAHSFAPTMDPLVTDEARANMDVAVTKLEDYLHELLEEKRRNPGEDLLSRLIEADEEGVLSDDEMRANVPLVFSAGLETTTHFIGNAVHSFMTNRDQWDLFCTDPDGLVKNAVEELLRYDSSVQSDPPLRLASEDIEIGGVTIAKGESVMPFIGSANRDPDEFENPDQLDITREDIRTVGFGGGVHVCLGQHLARVESQVALSTLAKRFPNIELTGPAPEWNAFANTRALKSLTIKLK